MGGPASRFYGFNLGLLGPSIDTKRLSTRPADPPTISSASMRFTRPHSVHVHSPRQSSKPS